MKQAIITGASGFIASYLTNQLTESGVEVLALGRRNFEDILYKRLKKNKKLTYINLEMNAINNLLLEMIVFFITLHGLAKANFLI